MNTHVDFETAKLLKEKGFDEKTRAIYQYKNLILDSDYEDGYRNSFNSFDWYEISAPTIAEVVMWLYEKHGIWIFVDFGLGWEGFTIPCGYNGNATTKELHWNNSNFNSPTEAYQEAIKYCLTKLI